jgi:hypothetical protein
MACQVFMTGDLSMSHLEIVRCARDDSEEICPYPDVS